MEEPKKIKVERVQTGVRIEKRLLKVLKAMAEYHDMTLGNLLENVLLHALEGSTFNDESLEVIAAIKKIYGLDYDPKTSHLFTEE
jgi:hypothetical protein